MKNLDFQDTNVVRLSQNLLGYKLFTAIEGNITSGIIVETEAYRAPEDKASHAFNGRRTKRTEVMFSEGGICYVYLCYGIHHLFNVVSGPENTAHAILVRALQPVEGIEVMRTRRGQSIKDHQLTNGPGKLCQAMGITRKQNGLSLDRKGENEVWLEPYLEIPESSIVHTKRVGVDYAQEWKEKLWRFYIAQNRYVSQN